MCSSTNSVMQGLGVGVGLEARRMCSVYKQIQYFAIKRVEALQLDPTTVSHLVITTYSLRQSSTKPSL